MVNEQISNNEETFLTREREEINEGDIRIVSSLSDTELVNLRNEANQIIENVKNETELTCTGNEKTVNRVKLIEVTYNNNNYWIAKRFTERVT